MRQLEASRYSSDCEFCAAHGTENYCKFIGCKKTTGSKTPIKWRKAGNLEASRYSSDCEFCAAHGTENYCKFIGCKKTTGSKTPIKWRKAGDLRQIHTRQLNAIHTQTHQNCNRATQQTNLNTFYSARQKPLIIIRAAKVSC